MFYIALFLLVLLGLISRAVVAQNSGVLLSDVSLNVFVGHLSIPVFLLCLLGACLGGLLLYVVSVFSARRDVKEIKSLRARIEELEEAQAKASSSGSPPASFAPPVVPVPGFPQTGPLGSGQPASSPLPPRQPSPSSSLLNLSPSSSGISSLQLPAKQPGTPPQSSSSSAPRPPFFPQ